MSEIGHWFTTDRYIAVVGFALTVLGVVIAIWQITRVRGAAEEAKRASLATRATIRSGSLGRLIQLSVDCRRRLDEVPLTATDAIKTIARDWITAYAKIEPLLSISAEIPLEVISEVTSVMRNLLTLARRLVDEQLGFVAYFGKTIDTGPFRQELIHYEVLMGGVLLLLEDTEVDRNA